MSTNSTFIGASRAGSVGPAVPPQLRVILYQLRPMHLHKDVTRIPYYVARELGWRSSILYSPGPEGSVDVPAGDAGVLSLEPCIDSASRLRQFVSSAAVVWRIAPETDVLQMYNLAPEPMLLSWVYRLRNRRGVAWLKLDMDERAVTALRGPLTLKQRLLLELLRFSCIDLFTVETLPALRGIEEQLRSLGKRVRYFPSGFDMNLAGSDIREMRECKENLILYVGHIGLPQKNVALLIDALERLPPEEIERWEVVLAGKVAEPGRVQWECRLRALEQRRPDVAKRLRLTGHLDDREQLFGLYRRARIFCLPSSWESFGLVLAEAAAFGCSIVSTDVGAARDLTDEGRLGWLVPPGDAGGLACALQAAMTAGPRGDRLATSAHAYVRERFHWPSVIRSLERLLHEHGLGGADAGKP